MELSLSRPPLRPLPAWAWHVLWGFAFWAVVVLALEPGNVMRALNAGRVVAVAEEARRIVGASLIGAVFMPLVVACARRLPLAHGKAVRNVALLALLALLLPVLAFGLLAVAEILQPLILSPDNPRLHRPFLTQAIADFPILLAALAVAAALIQLTDRRLPKMSAARDAAPAGADSGYASRIAAPTGTEILMVDVASIGWLESQGNYVALHAGAKAHLVRMTLTQLQAQLDPKQFLRIHRRLVVNRSQLAGMRRAGNGDAFVTLRDGTELRASRTYAEQVRGEFR